MKRFVHVPLNTENVLSRPLLQVCTTWWSTENISIKYYNNYCTPLMQLTLKSTWCHNVLCKFMHLLVHVFNFLRNVFNSLWKRNNWKSGVTNPAYIYHNISPTIIPVCNAQWTCFEYPVSFGSQITKEKKHTVTVCTYWKQRMHIQINYVFLRFTKVEQTVLIRIAK